MYKYESYVKLPETDAAGIVFFANYIRLAHDVYEKFIEEIGFSLYHVITEADFYLLIAHTEADYKQPLKLNEKYSVHLNVEKIGKTSFTLSYEFYNSKNELAAVVKTVHVTVKKTTGKPVLIEENLKLNLSKHV